MTIRGIALLGTLLGAASMAAACDTDTPEDEDTGEACPHPAIDVPARTQAQDPIGSRQCEYCHAFVTEGASALVDRDGSASLEGHPSGSSVSCVGCHGGDGDTNPF